jgi:hypothetical protein
MPSSQSRLLRSAVRLRRYSVGPERLKLMIPTRFIIYVTFPIFLLSAVDTYHSKLVQYHSIQGLNSFFRLWRWRVLLVEGWLRQEVESRSPKEFASVVVSSCKLWLAKVILFICKQGGFFMLSVKGLLFIRDIRKRTAVVGKKMGRRK